MTRALSLCLPLLTVLVVAYAMIVGAVPRKVQGARVYGGPTENVGELSLRAEVVERDGEKEIPFWNSALVARVDQGGRVSEVRVSRALAGVADFQVPIDPATIPLELELRDADDRLLAQGPLTLSAAAWAARAQRRGGWIRGREADGLQLAVAPERGVLVVGASERVSIRALRGGSAAAGLRLTVSAQGARVQAPTELVTSERGLAAVSVEPTELNPTFRVEVAGERALIDTGLLVVPGGLHVALESGRARISSPVPRSVAFYGLVTTDRRLTGGALALAATDAGGAEGFVELGAVPSPAWLVVSSEVDEHSAAAIGWPIHPSSEPTQTFDVPEVLLLDGLPAAFEREQGRRSRVRWLSASLIGLALALSALLLVLRVRNAERLLATHLQTELGAENTARVAPPRALALLVAVATLVLGYLAFALLVAVR